MSNEIVPASHQITTLRGALKGLEADLMRVLPKRISTERFTALVLNTVKRTPALLDCTLPSILGSVVGAAELGLQLDGALGQAYLVPYYHSKSREKRAQLIPGYRGMVRLALQGGYATKVSARAVYEGDKFEWEMGTSEFIRHTPIRDSATAPDPKKLTHVYCVIEMRDTSPAIDVMTRGELELIRKRSKSGNAGPWITDYEAMCLKTVARRALKWVPMDSEAARLIGNDERLSAGLEPEEVDYEIVEPTEDDSPLAGLEASTEPPTEPRNPPKDPGSGEQIEEDGWTWVYDEDHWVLYNSPDGASKG